MDKALKQRLVGASVLIALAVIVLPMLLSGRPDGGAQETQKIELPPQPAELDFETRRYPIGQQAERGQGAEQGTEPEDAVTQLPAPRNSAAVPAVSDPEPQPEPEQEQEHEQAEKTELPDSAPPIEAAPSPEPPASSGNTPKAGRYVVQVASFGSVENANKLSAALRQSGYTVSTDRIKSDVGTLHRVRVGPYAGEAEANQAVQALESTQKGVKPRVMDLQPEQTAQVTTPDDPLVRWVVQVGSFSSVANAERLVASLRQDGLSAYQETVTSSGSEIFRVRVGPFLQREEAIRTERHIREDRSLSGVVMSAD